MPFVADDLGAWLIGLLADTGRKKLITWVLGNEQERAVRQAATAAIWHVARELRPEGGGRAEHLAMVVSEVFGESVPTTSLGLQWTLLEALQAGIARQLAVLEDASLTGTGRSSAQVLGVPVTTLADKLTGHLVREIVVRGAHSGPLEALAAQLNHDVTHLQGQRLEHMLRTLTDEVRNALARRDNDQLLPPSSLGARVVSVSKAQSESISSAVGADRVQSDDRLQQHAELRPLPLPSVGRIVDQMLSVGELANPAALHHFLSLLPTDILSTLSFVPQPRAQLVNVIRRCRRAGIDGREALVNALSLTVGDPELSDMFRILDSEWPTAPEPSR